MSGTPFSLFDWRKPFLPALKDFIARRTDGCPGRALLVVPHNRPWRYLQHLYALDGKPVLLPKVMTFTELLNYYYRDASQGDKYAVPTYGMFNLASNFNPAYDQSYEWTLDPDMVAQGYNLNRLYNEALDALSMNMVYGVDSSDVDSYMAYWKAFVMLWNAELPQIPLYSNVYVTLHPDWLEGYEQDSFWNFEQAILYATVAE